MLSSCKWIYCVCLLCLCFVPNSWSQVVVTVDDNSANDSAYVNGVGGNFSGSTAVQDAVVAINADSGQPSYVVNIVDTDGVADTYVGNFEMNVANTAVRQVANGSGTDKAVTLQGSDASGAASFLIQAASCSLSGLSADAQMIIKTAGTTACTIITGINAAADGAGNAVWNNLKYASAGNEVLDHNDFNAGTGGGNYVEVFNNCYFSVGNGPQTFVNVQFNECQFAGGGFKSVQLDGHVEANNCAYEPASAGGLHLAGALSTTWNDCSFAVGSPRLLGGNLSSGTFTFNRPVWAGKNGDVTFNIANSGAHVIIAGEPDAKNNLDPLITAGTALISRLTSGSISFIDCTRSLTGCNLLDCSDGSGLVADVEINMDRCVWLNGSAHIDLADNGASTFGITLSATNTIWVGATTAGDFIHTRGDRTGTSYFNLLHCTMQGPTANTSFSGNTNTAISETGKARDIFNVKYSILDDTGSNAVSGDFGNNNGTLLGSGNLMTNAGKVCPGFCGGVPDGFTAVTTTDPLIDDAGHLTAGSPALGQAIGSTLDVDVDGEERPQGGLVNDIGACESPLEAASQVDNWIQY